MSTTTTITQTGTVGSRIVMSCMERSLSSPIPDRQSRPTLLRLTYPSTVERRYGAPNYSDAPWPWQVMDGPGGGDFSALTCFENSRTDLT